MELSEPVIVREIANRTAGNVRRLEGAMTRVLALSSVLGKPITTGLVHQALDDPRRAEPTPRPTDDAATVMAIQEATCTVLGVSRDDLLSPRRTARVSQARQLAIYLSRQLTSLSLAQIARHFDRDHSTILHAIRTTATKLEPGSETASLLDRTRDLLPPIQPTSASPDAALQEPADSQPPPSTSAIPTTQP